jgi:hypothetical protein
MAGTTGLEPAASAVTGQRSNQLNYVPTRQINDMRNRQCLCSAISTEQLCRLPLYEAKSARETNATKKMQACIVTEIS